MRRIKLPSASTAVALLALFIALGGTGYAAAKLNGKNIKNKTIAGKKLKSNTLAGKQIKESKLGTVPKAKFATSAGTANALTAAGSSGLVPRAKVVETDLVKFTKVGTSAANSPLRTVLQSGPFKVEVGCFAGPGAGETGQRFRITSTEPGSYVNNTPLPLDDASTPTPDSGADDSVAALVAPSGKTLMLDLYSGVNYLGADCLFAADGIASY